MGVCAPVSATIHIMDTPGGTATVLEYPAVPPQYPHSTHPGVHPRAAVPGPVLWAAPGHCGALPPWGVQKVLAHLKEKGGIGEVKLISDQREGDWDVRRARWWRSRRGAAWSI